MTSPPLVLRQYIIDKVEFTAHPIPELPKDAKENIVNVEAAYSIEDNKFYSMGLNISVNDFKEASKTKAYTVKISVFGFFNISGDYTQEEIKNLFHPIAATNLYGIARGIIGQLTGDGPYGKMVLPTINLYEHMKEVPDFRNTASKKKKKTAKKKRATKVQ